MDLKKYFDRVVMINLRRRPDRLGNIDNALKASKWPFKWPEVFEATDGDAIPCPSNWQSGGGAWGCMRSHQQILEKAMMDNVSSVLIMEDDVCFVPDFHIKVSRFLEAVPDDWDQLMLGGQHVNINGRPILIKPGVYRCTDCERTHCYAIRGEFMRKLYQRWVSGGDFNGEVHCDWIMGRDPAMQLAHKVYAPEEFLAGQDRGKSDINGGYHPKNFWNPPSPELIVVHLRAPQPVVAKLREYGFHTGYDRDAQTDFDNGLAKVFAETGDDKESRIERMANWLNCLQWEVASDPYLICTVWHPKATPKLVKQASRWQVLEIVAESVEEAIAKLPKKLRRPRRLSLANTFVIHLEAPQHVMEALRKQGFHNGYWRCSETGRDMGIIQLLKEFSRREDRVKALAVNLRTIQREAESIHQGVAVVWHPNIDIAMARAATKATVIPIRATNTRAALDQWDEVKATLRAAETVAAEDRGRRKSV